MRLIEIHSEKPESHHCEICDGMRIEGLTKWYETEREFQFKDGTRYNRRVYVLECCKHKGNLVDWEER